jgi:AcrR family transcriptional regulator
LLVDSDAEPLLPGRGRGRPIGADSTETRARILRAAREVINERGYEAANFQAIASRAGLSRPTMHYYFHTREEIYDSWRRRIRLSPTALRRRNARIPC